MMPERDVGASGPISIEHEDPFVPATTGVPEAARLLGAAIQGAVREPA